MAEESLRIERRRGRGQFQSHPCRKTAVNRRNHERYQEYYAIYRNLYENIKHDMHALARTAEWDDERIAPEDTGGIA